MKFKDETKKFKKNSFFKDDAKNFEDKEQEEHFSNTTYMMSDALKRKSIDNKKKEKEIKAELKRKKQEEKFSKKKSSDDKRQEDNSSKKHTEQPNNSEYEHNQKESKRNKPEKTKESQKKSSESKNGKKDKKKLGVKAAIQNGLSNALEAKGKNDDGLINDKSTDDAYKDGRNGAGRFFLDVINPMTYIRKLLKLLEIIAIPFIAIFMCVIVLGFFISGVVFAGMKIAQGGTANGIDEYLAQYANGTGPRFSTLSFEEQQNIINSTFCDETQKKVISFALSKVGYAYSQPRRTSGSAFDCSSLAFYAYCAAGLDIANGDTYPPTADNEALNMLHQGKVIDANSPDFKLEPGDLVFYRGSNNSYFMNISHVAIYIGNGYCVEALGEKYGVVYNPLRTKNAILVGKIK